MPSTSKSNRRRSGKSKFVPKPKQEWRVKQPTRNWLDLPSDITLNILQRVGVIDILENAQKVCTAWRKICKDPAMWRVICMDKFPRGSERGARQKMCKLAVDRSQGQLVDLDLTMIGFCDDELLKHVTNRSSQLRRLEIKFSLDDMSGDWGEAFKKLSLLEELSLGPISKEDIEAAGRYCPLLKSLKLNLEAIKFSDGSDDDAEDHDVYEDSMIIKNETALAIAKNLPQLTHLELIGNDMDNTGLQALLDGCCHLESLDLRRCLNIDLKGDLGKRCSQQIKFLKLPRDSLKGCPHVFTTYDVLDDFEANGYSYVDDEDEYSGYSEYDDYTANFDDNGLFDFEHFDDDALFNFEDLTHYMAYKDMLERFDCC